MSNEVLLSSKDYLKLRSESREALNKLGVPSNPGFTNEDILNGLAKALETSFELGEVDEVSDFSGEFFRDGLGEILGLEIPPAIEDVVVSLRSISK